MLSIITKQINNTVTPMLHASYHRRIRLSTNTAIHSDTLSHRFTTHTTWIFTRHFNISFLLFQKPLGLFKFLNTSMYWGIAWYLSIPMEPLENLPSPQSSWESPKSTDPSQFLTRLPPDSSQNHLKPFKLPFSFLRAFKSLKLLGKYLGS